MAQKQKLLLHTCCACCGAWIPEMLSADYDVTLYYFNPNIHPEAEYRHRLEDARRVAGIHGVGFIEADYNPQNWFDKIQGFENEKEGGARCPLCFELRLRETARSAKELGFDIWSTTLTVGRNKKADVINAIGEKLAQEFGIPFLARDFKKQAGLDISVARCDDFKIVRQNYCGCVFSRKEQYLRTKSRKT